jgi:hypothetical protein
LDHKADPVPPLFRTPPWFLTNFGRKPRPQSSRPYIVWLPPTRYSHAGGGTHMHSKASSVPLCPPPPLQPPWSGICPPPNVSCFYSSHPGFLIIPPLSQAPQQPLDICITSSCLVNMLLPYNHSSGKCVLSPASVWCPLYRSSLLPVLLCVM